MKDRTRYTIAYDGDAMIFNLTQDQYSLLCTLSNLDLLQEGVTFITAEELQEYTP